MKSVFLMRKILINSTQFRDLYCYLPEIKDESNALVALTNCSERHQQKQALEQHFHWRIESEVNVSADFIPFEKIQSLSARTFNAAAIRQGNERHPVAINR
jgi:hypothetical protein